MIAAPADNAIAPDTTGLNFFRTDQLAWEGSRIHGDAREHRAAALLLGDAPVSMAEAAELALAARPS